MREGKSIQKKALQQDRPLLESNRCLLGFEWGGDGWGEKLTGEIGARRDAMILRQVDVPFLRVNRASGAAWRDALEVVCLISVETLTSACKLSSARS